MARPKSDNPKKESIRIRVTPELKEQLRELAEHKGLSMSTLVTLLLSEYMDNNEKNNLLLKDK